MIRALTIAVLMLLPAHAHGADMVASWYGRKSGGRTANGERFDELAATCAMRQMPFGALMQVSYRGRAIVCRVNDRGPAPWTGRGIDLSRGMAIALGLEARGVAVVHVERIDR